tara:strand:+ start:158 stop:547 length:390 start_codon:yes stop_codon:yes gene_type:complete
MPLDELIHFDEFKDSRGSLVAAEFAKQIPFLVKRIYCIYPKPGFERGFHAHKKIDQIAIPISGKCEILMDNGEDSKTISLDSRDIGLRIPPMIWHVISYMSDDCILLVLASDIFDEDDYIRDYQTFIGM